MVILRDQALYLPAHSYHTTHNKSGFIKGEGIRYAKTSSTPEEFKNILNLFKIRLQKRGYNLNFINKLLYQVKWKYRSHYLKPVKKSKEIPFLFKICYNPIVSHQFLRQSLNEFSAAIKDIRDLPTKMSPPITICYKAPPKLLTQFLSDRKKKGF